MLGLGMSGFGTILGAVNFITTIITMRAPGMTMWRMPIFSWNTLVTSILVLMAFPVLAAAILAAAADRVLGAHIYDPANGGVLLWQHLFWFFGHPEVYIIALPFFGIISEILPVFSRKPIFGYKTLVYATIAIAALSVAVWAHHMYVTGAVLLPFFALMTMLIAVPTGVKIFNWIGTMWRGSVTFETPMLFALGFLVSFVFGGLTGVILASPPLDFHALGLVLRGRALPLRGVRHGRVRDVRRVLLLVAEVDRPDAERAARHGALLDAVHRVPHDLPDPALAGRGRHGAPLRGLLRGRRLDLGEPGLHGRRDASSGASMIPFLFNVWITARKAPRVTVNDPWGYGASLEWATSCPPPRHNFTSIPRIRSERPAFDLNHPEAGIPVGVGPAKDAPEAPVVDLDEGKVK